MPLYLGCSAKWPLSLKPCIHLHQILWLNLAKAFEVTERYAPLSSGTLI